MMYPRNSKFFLRARLKSKAQSRKKIDWIGIGLIFLGLFSFYCVVFPEFSGLWGNKTAQVMGWMVGAGRYFLPLIVGYAGIWLLFHAGKKPRILKIVFPLVLYWVFLIFLSLIGDAVWQKNYGGVVGGFGRDSFFRLFGKAGSWIVVGGLLATLSSLIAGISPGEILVKLREIIIADWQQWKRARKSDKKEKRPPVVKPVVNNGREITKSSVPKIVRESPDYQVKEGGGALNEKGRNEHVFPRPVKPAEKTTPMAPAPKTPVFASPSIDLFQLIPKNSPVSPEELTQRARLLEQTLANFGIAAHVVEIHPGPVITRYDLEPAPGVKVSSITSRSDDIALAMRSVGIRMIAPIPGKGAVGVEIPNLNPETVGLRELLQTPQFLNHKSPLAFVLGKTVSGEPSIVDLATMPHLLIAGATGSGKSVAIHSLLSSILYRMPPDLVKFVLIDPKRLELPSYSQIPHLFDPRHSPMNAEVITNSKQAAKALSRLVKVMEFRYDLFAKANVRNIESYNEKKKAAGEPLEYYLVVVIDELADLMLSSPKEVEDSVQRLAQMARAVGIHLVLATQRPSVDVITGVIKANLPARIALRVSSSIDSRVILDVVGAESLQGKGDMLYLPAGVADPVRVQGAFVSEKDVHNLVEHLKQFGLPSYEDLFASGSALEFAVEDKKELVDLIEALKLILERHRVSQDLLKAHFGSSARATNILSLLEVKQFIAKPEGSNRWEINFDMIEDFLSRSERIPEEEIMA